MDTKPNMKLQMKICGYGMFLKNCPINVMVTKSLPNPKLGVYKEYLGVNVSTSIEAIDKFLKIYNIWIEWELVKLFPQRRWLENLNVELNGSVQIWWF